MPDICFYFQVHQPYRLRRYRIFDIGSDTTYFDDEANRAILRRVADKCYIPTNRLLTEAIRRSEGASGLR
jgi:alpha-amylase